MHDAHTKGRKSPTHLILDAWSKGIRRLTVVYYHHVPTVAVAELLEAAATMGVTVRLGGAHSSELGAKGGWPPGCTRELRAAFDGGRRCAHVGARRLLEDPQVELRQHGEDVVEDVRL